MLRQQILTRIRKTIIIILITSILILLLLNPFLRYVDPWGSVAYHYSLRQLIQYGGFVRDGKLAYQPGRHELLAYTVTINPDNTRYIPANSGGECTIAFVGDSITFGQSVNDAETFVNLIAADMPGINFINPSVVGYNTADVRYLLDLYAANGYVYLMIENDALPTEQREAIIFLSDEFPSPLHVYLADYHFRQPGMLPNYELDRFHDDVAYLTNRSDIMIFGFEGYPLIEATAAQYRHITLIPRYTHVKSISDAHPNAAGHRQIYEAIREAVRAFIVARCGEVRP
jgi:hypothetical protein